MGGRASALAHLAQHARSTPLPHHLRTCRCREEGCTWHTRHRGCEGGILLALTRRAATWRLADLCRGCAAATPHTARVEEAASVPLPPVVPHTEEQGIDTLFDDTEETGAWWFGPEEHQPGGKPRA